MSLNAATLLILVMLVPMIPMLSSFAQTRGSSTKLFVFAVIALGELVGMSASLLTFDELITTSSKLVTKLK